MHWPQSPCIGIQDLTLLTPKAYQDCHFRAAICGICAVGQRNPYFSHTSAVLFFHSELGTNCPCEPANSGTQLQAEEERE